MSAAWRRHVPAGLALLLLGIGLGGGPAPAQGLLNRSSGPIAIDADEGIEWRRDEKVYIATGNAKAERGDVTVTAHRLIAYYRERPAPPGAAKPSGPAATSAAASGPGATGPNATGPNATGSNPSGKDADSGVSSTDIYRLV